MVSVIAQPTAAPASSGFVEVVQTVPPPKAVANRAACPRCEGQLRTSYHEPECLRCGYVSYTYQPARLAGESIVSSGTRSVVRYVGDFPQLSQVLTHVKLYRLRNRVVYGVTCPFCLKSMTQTSLSGKRREVQEERYRCLEGHRISLTPRPNGSIGWK